MIRRTIFSDCRKYRYTLWRAWDRIFNTNNKYIAFIGLNPSTADETTDDNTVRRCISFAKRDGFAAMCMLNLFALRATNPRKLRNVADPIGQPENDQHILDVCRGARLIVAAWGIGGEYLDRDKAVCKLLDRYELHCLARTRDGGPRHPLYLSNDVKLRPWRQTRKGKP